MNTTRKILVGAALGLAALGAAAPAEASVAPPASDGATDMSTATDDAAAKRCRWRPAKGLVCNTNGPFETITL